MHAWQTGRGRLAALLLLPLLAACHHMGGPGYGHMAGGPAHMAGIAPGMARSDVTAMLGPGAAGSGSGDCTAYMYGSGGPYGYMHVWYDGDRVSRVTRGPGPACAAP
ncbi:hypothetical protein [Poseidonocella sp. HB161398]|uniref:hypothetical protein n=1 Tax=Poseidonocella sp. HB161398 TaxID=2320855 RepID=UPI001107E48C|nr:hypothetical protein [Poseidonocella sp. HB161398]